MKRRDVLLAVLCFFIQVDELRYDVETCAQRPEDGQIHPGQESGPRARAQQSPASWQPTQQQCAPGPY